MIDQRPQDGRGGGTAERADKGPVIFAGPALPAAVAGGDLRGVVEKMRCLGEHGIPRILPCSITATGPNSMTWQVMALVRHDESAGAISPAEIQADAPRWASGCSD